MISRKYLTILLFSGLLIALSPSALCNIGHWSVAFQDNPQQNSNSPEKELSRLAVADSLLDQFQHKSALELLKQTDFTVPVHAFKAQLKMGQILIHLNSAYSAGLTHFNQAQQFLTAGTTNIPKAMEADLYFELVLAHYQLNHYDSTVYFSRRFEALAHESKAWKRQYFEARQESASPQLANIWNAVRTKLEQVIPQQPEAIPYLVDTYDRLTRVHKITNMLDSQVYYAIKGPEFLASLDRHDPLLMANALATASDPLMRGALLDRSHDYVKRSIALFDSLGINTHAGLSSAYYMKSSILTWQPNARNEALDYALESLRMIKSIFGENHTKTIDAIKQVGLLYIKLEDYDKALEYHNMALGIAMRNQWPGDFVLSLNYKALAYIGLKDFKTAEALFQQALSMVKGNLGTSSEPYARLTENSGHMEMARENYAVALDYFNEAIPIYINIFDPIHPVLAHVYLHMGQCYEKLGEFEKAIEFYDKTVYANRSRAKAAKEWVVVDQLMSLKAYDLKAKILSNRANTLNESALYQASMDMHLKNANDLKGLLESGNHIRDLAGISAIHKNAYTGAISAALSLDSFDETAQRKEVLFSMSEKSRAVLLRMQQSSILSNLTETITNPDTRRELELKKEINYWTSMINNLSEGADEALTDYRAKRFELKQQLKALQSQSDGLGLEEILNFDLTQAQAALDTNTTLIEYYELPESFLVFVVCKDQFDYQVLKKPAALDSLLDQQLIGLNEHQPNAFAANSFQLYNMLFAPFADKVKTQKLIIIPDGLIWKLDFDLLVSEPGKKQPATFQEMDYLIKTKTISYAYSMAGLAHSKKQTTQHNGRILGFSYEEDIAYTPLLDEVRDGKRSDLPGTAMEMKGVKQQLRGDFYFGETASETNFKAQAPQSQILHLAVHGEADTLYDERSRLYFNTAPVDTLEDGILHSFELYNMKLQAELAVLSACYTGAGRLINGEGVISIGRAFQYAGVKSVLMSHWQVSDAVAPLVMNDFYGYLQEGYAKDEAMRQAKLNFLEQANNISANPLYWGGFFIMGNSEPIKIASKVPYWPYLAALLALIIVLVLVRRYAKRRRQLEVFD